MTDELSPEVLITNIPFKCDEEDVRACCAQYGDVTRVQLAKKDGKFRGSANVLFRTLEMAYRMATQNGKVKLRAQEIKVKQLPTRTAILYFEHTSLAFYNGRLSVGQMGRENNAFIPVHKIDSPMVGSFALAQRRIFWELKFQLKIAIHFKDVSGEITTSMTMQGEPTITIHLRRPPKIYEYDNQLSKTKGDPWKRKAEKNNTLANHFGKYLVHHFVLPPQEQKNVILLLTQLSEFGDLVKYPIISFPIKIVTPDNSLLDSTLPFEVLYKIEALITANIVPSYEMVDITYAKDWQLFIDRVGMLDSPTAVATLESMLAAKKRIYNLPEALDSALDNLEGIVPILPNDMVMMRKLIITPLRFSLLGPEPEISNRVVRKYSEHVDRFLRVSFLDEGFLPVSVGEIVTSSVINRFRHFLKSGFTIANQKYEFLAFSSSQLRQHSCWFFAPLPYLNCDDIRRWMGDFSKAKSIAKCAARMGQCFSTTFDTLKAEVDDVQLIDDVYTTPDPTGKSYCFTDGVGKMSFEFAEGICQMLNIPDTSAFQSRFKGGKGVWVKWPDMKHKLAVRPSMLKFESTHDMFEVITPARFVPAFLNRQLIQLLANAGVPNEPFIELQQKMIHKLEMMPICAKTATKILTSRNTEYGVNNMIIEALKHFPIEELFIQNFIRTFVTRFMRDLKLKTRILLPKAGSLLGVIDELGVLDYKKVFVQITDPKTNLPKIITGPVVISKPPCLHPGDVRVLIAVDIPELHHIKDCIVFPKKGPRPHTNEASGSDLDGDRYLVIWDQRFKAADYDAPITVEQFNIKIEDIINFFVNYIQNDSLGMIAHAHMAISDHANPNHPNCISLAALHSIAVDFPKTGIPAKMTAHLRPELYPDFMEKRDRPSYQSIKIIGILFRQIDSPHLSLINIWHQVKVDPDMIYPNYEHYVKEAIEFKKQYNFSLRCIMNQFGIKHESEAISGHILKFHRHLKNKDQESTQAVRRAVFNLRRYWRAEFLREFENPDLTESEKEISKKEKASAWYMVTYEWRIYDENILKAPEGKKEKVQTQRAENRDFLISFPWIMYDLLCIIKKEKQ